MRFKLILAIIQTERKEKPAKCPACGSRHIQHWQNLVRKVRDTKVEQVEVDRWRCKACHITFRTMPEGITKTIITRRLHSGGIALYMLGLSYRGVEDFLTAMGFPISYSSVYPAVQKAAEHVKGLKREEVLQSGKTAALGADITGVKFKGKWTSLGITVDDVSGIVLTVDLLTEQTGEAIARWIGPIAEAVGAELVVTDDAENFRTAVTQFAVPHQVCKAHVLRNTEALVQELRPLVQTDRDGSLARCKVSPAQAEEDLQHLLECVHTRLPEDAPHLRKLHGRYRHAQPPQAGEKWSLAYRLRLLFLDRWNLWNRLTCYRTWKGSGGETIDGTNNGCERPIGWNIKERYRSLRGYKRIQSALNVSRLLCWGRNGRLSLGADLGSLFV